MFYVHSIPRVSQAESTSGDPKRRYTVSCMNDPLKVVVEYFMSTSFNTGALCILQSAIAYLLPIMIGIAEGKRGAFDYR
jgi:hypothetical protein